MIIFKNPLILFFIPILITGCNTMYSTRTVKLETAVPARVIFPSGYNTIAIRYNNSNASFNPHFAEYIENRETFTDTLNTDSIASKVYFDTFAEKLKQPGFFPRIWEIEPGDFPGYHFEDSLTVQFKDVGADSSKIISGTATALLNHLLTRYPPKVSDNTKTMVVNPEFGLYSERSLKAIADSTGADLLLSLDYFATLEYSGFAKEQYTGFKAVYVLGFWNFYDLKNMSLKYFYDRVDTISWIQEGMPEWYVKGKLPPRKDAVLNAAEISGEHFAHFLVPHWIEVERMYYHSGHVDLRQTDNLVQEGRWLEAAEIWQKQIRNPNKYIAAKSMFNMALACEMEGNMDAAIDWAVKSYYVFKQKNEAHSYNCQQYIRILSQRKDDLKKIELQLNPDKITK